MRRFNIYTILFALAISIFLSCNTGNVKPQATTTNSSYTNEAIGWSIEVPEGWKVITKDQLEKDTEKGVKAMEDVVEGEIDYSGLKHLVGFEKDRFNSFSSTTEPFNLEYKGEWEENNKKLKKIMYQTYVEQGIKADSSETTIEKIDGLDFERYDFTIYDQEGTVILRQILYSRWINGLDFGVNINYNKDEHRDELLKAWRGSTFKK